MDYDDIEWTTDPYIGGGGGSGGGSGASSGSGSGNLDDNNLDTPVLTISDQFVGLPICFFPVDEEVQKFRVSLYAYAN